MILKKYVILYDSKVKYSFRLYFKASISYFNIPILFKTVFDKYDIIDNSVYNRNRILFTPMNKIKKDDVVPELKIVNGDIFDNCATYIKEDYMDLDLKIEKKKDVKKKLNLMMIYAIIDDRCLIPRNYFPASPRVPPMVLATKWI